MTSSNCPKHDGAVNAKQKQSERLVFTAAYTPDFVANSLVLLSLQSTFTGITFPHLGVPTDQFTIHQHLSSTSLYIIRKISAAAFSSC